MAPAHKKKEKSDESNYSPVSVLSNYSKVYEKLMYNQVKVDFKKDIAPNIFFSSHRKI